MTQEEGDDGLREKVRDGAVEHAADRADAIVQLDSASAVAPWPRLSMSCLDNTYHSGQIALASADEIAFERGRVGVAQRERISVVCPNWNRSGSTTLRAVPDSGLTIVEYTLNVRCRRVRDQSQLGEHCTQHVPRQCRLHNIGPIQAINAATMLALRHMLGVPTLS